MRNGVGGWRRAVGLPAAAMILAGGAISAAAIAWWAAPASASTIHVNSEGAFRTAFNSNLNDTIVLDSDIHLTSTTGCSEAIRDTANNPLTVDGQGQFKIVQDCPGFGVLLVPNPDTTNLTVRGLTITGGTNSNDGGGMEFEGGSLTVDHVNVVNNTADTTPNSSDGGGIDAEGHAPMTVIASTFSGNSAGDDGGGLNCDQTGLTITVTGSTFNGNSTTAGHGDSGSAIDMESTNCSVTLINSTVTSNTSGDDAAITAEDTGDKVTLVYSSIVNNATNPATPGVQSSAKPKTANPHGDVNTETNPPGPAVATANVEVSAAANLTIFGSVVARPHGGPNCSTTGGVALTGTVSVGYNFADDTSCGLGTATDKQGAGLDPLLGPLASNGGPTQTLLPATGSPLIDAIAAAACQTGPAAGVTTDQRSVSRPQGPGCDIGAVEVAVPVPLIVTPRFTG